MVDTYLTSFEHIEEQTCIQITFSGKLEKTKKSLEGVVKNIPYVEGIKDLAQSLREILDSEVEVFPKKMLKLPPGCTQVYNQIRIYTKEAETLLELRIKLIQVWKEAIQKAGFKLEENSLFE